MGLDGLDNAFIGSPMKKQRASVSGPDDESLRRRMGSGRISAGIHEILGTTPPAVGAGCLAVGGDDIPDITPDIVVKDESKPAVADDDEL
jgi:hypothetical protein